MDHEEKNSSPESSGSQSSQQLHYEKLVLNEAYEHLSKRKYAAASRIFEDVLKKYAVVLEKGQKSIIEAELAQLYFWLADYDRAMFHAQTSVGARSDNEQALTILGKIAIAQYKFTEARGFFGQLSASNPAKYLGLCLIAIRLRDTKDATHFVRLAAKYVSPADGEYRVLAAYCRLLSGDASGAISEIREILKDIEHDPALLLIVAEIFMTAGHYGEANAVAEKVEKFCPKNDQVFALYAHSDYFDEEYTAAEKNARTALRINPRNAYAKTVLMKLATRAGSYSRAEHLGKEILEQAPQYSLAHANLGDVYFNEGNYGLAEIEYEQTNSLMSADTKGARLRTARMKFIQKDYKQAALILEKLIEMHHTYYDDAMCDLALCYDALSDTDKKEELKEKMEMRRSFYHRTEKLLKMFEEGA